MPGVILFDRTADFPVKYKSFFDTGMGFFMCPCLNRKLLHAFNVLLYNIVFLNKLIVADARFVGVQLE